MSESTTSYDEQLKKEIPHYNSYPKMLPFVGSQWGKHKRLLLLGESHYIDGKKLSQKFPDFDYQKEWYELDEKKLSTLSGNIHTRGVVKKADLPKVQGFSKALSIFYNVKKEIKGTIPVFSNEPTVFQYFSFMNYFQRPAFIEGDSIINNSKDNEVAYQALKGVLHVISPDAIVFTSSKAHNAFWWSRKQDGESSIFNNIKISHVPHPGCAWWGRKSKSYGKTHDWKNRTGRQKFQAILKEVFET